MGSPTCFWFIANNDRLLPGPLPGATQLRHDLQAISRLIIRLRELTAQEGSVTQAEELAVLAWALADLSEFAGDSTLAKLRSEPVIPLLQTRYQGAAIYAYQRLLETLGL